jgi:hypothetical protein
VLPPTLRNRARKPYNQSTPGTAPTPEREFSSERIMGQWMRVD